jgi:two-component system, chemotaxis family, protein-glutamate methylesterase/glutaminase
VRWKQHANRGVEVARRDVVVVGGSAGGVEALADLVGGLPPAFPAAIFAVIHFPDRVTSVLPAILTRSGPLPAHHARHGETIERGRIYVAPPGYHLMIDEATVRLSSGPRENGHRPALDPLFRSAARAYGPRVVGVVLSGNLDDGAAGLLAIKQRGGVAVVQDPDNALYPGMPQSAIRAVPVDHVVALPAIAPLLEALTAAAVEEVRMSVPDPSGAVGSHETEDESRAADRQQQPGVPTTMSCPECHGTLWELREGELVGFRCRIGHAFTADTLVAQQAESLEAALWTALRALEEHAALNRRMAARARDREHAHSAASFTEHAVDLEHHASIIRNVLEHTLPPPAATVARAQA